MKLDRILTYTATAVALAFAAPAGATIIGGGVSSINQSFVKLPVPFAISTPDNTVGSDNFNLDVLFGFDEDQNVSVTGAPLVSNVPSTSLPVGTVVASHYVFYDPLSGVIDGYVEFDAPILAIMTDTAELAASDYLANTGVTYLSPGARGLEPGDTATIDSGDPNRVLIHLAASTPGDYIRVLTAFSPAAAAVPAPGTLALIGPGLAALGFARRRR